MFFIPEKIKVGYQNRSNTYTNKLAYIIYYDAKNVLRKETSWQGWRDKTIEPNDFTNEPTEGFVLNMKAGGYSTGWNHRQTYTRIYDPRGFEFEITVDNLLYILENTNSIVGKGLEGTFVYGWNGKDLVLIPTSAPDYKEHLDKSQNMFNSTKVKTKELVEGRTYRRVNGEEVIYLGRMYEYDRFYGFTSKGNDTYYKSEKTVFWFYDADSINQLNEGTYYKYLYKTYKSLPELYTTTDNISSDFDLIMEKIETVDKYKPKKIIKFVDVSEEDFNNYFGRPHNNLLFTKNVTYGGISFLNSDESIQKLNNKYKVINRNHRYYYGNSVKVNEEHLTATDFIKRYNLKLITEDKD